ncbi:hypothetical protein F5148DRAFT_985394 [Russula earlei]|uniref:Uncharacterized protein n=1 Tax=Russula earlei TaxID=71964 RepID=A0ACC0TYJ1_9AGAM|nr:hypothetical protein F5148DRAFT_985394 [Russula earlei]
MIVILSILSATRATPVPQSSPLSLNQFRARASSCDDPRGCRSLWDILWSCAVTILLCTWVSVHPNIPSPYESRARVAVRRVGLMLAALFVPEAVIGWALRQRLAAVELAKNHKGEGWTTTHGFFAIMGGFMEYEGNRPIRVLLPEELNSYSLTGNGDFPRIAKEEIEDKSKGDAISKTLVILQTGWFVVQCIARGVRGLPVTELELVTVAFATLNFVMYILWWDKPLNVQRGVRVYKKRDADEPVDDGGIEATSLGGFWDALGDALSDLGVAIVRGPLAESFDDQMWLTRVLMWPFMKPAFIAVGERETHTMMVGTFYPHEWGNELRSAFAWVAVLGITLTFGGIHCIGWSFNFPSSAEQTLWRVASVTITAAPILFPVVPFLVGIDNSGDWNLSRSFRDLGLLFLTLCVVVSPSLYMLSRSVLLVLPFLSLRSLSPAAYHVVHWTSIIPHI